ncbi:hypothetical protein ELG62_00450 [Rhizobium leguminosarum]|nr:hypothetical protein ELG62_00450 [Rhizobium leguminosarum]
MSRKSVPRFCDNDMRKDKELKREGESERSRRALERWIFPYGAKRQGRFSVKERNSAPDEMKMGTPMQWFFLFCLA